MNTRRKFLFDCSAVVAALAAMPVSSAGLSAMLEAGFSTREPLSHAVLAAQINTIFRVRRASGQTVKLKLLKAPLAPPTPARPGRRPPGDAGYEKFSLIFSGPKSAPLASAIHQFEHDQLGWFEIYVGQIGSRDAGSVRYEAVFNQPAAATFARTQFI